MHGTGYSLVRRRFVAAGAAGLFTLHAAEGFQPLVVSVNIMFDQGVQSGKGLSENQRSKFWSFQEKARREYAVSGIQFEIRIREGAFLRQQGYSQIPSRFLVPKTINLFVTETLGYDIDRDRTGGCSIGPHPPWKLVPGDPFYKIFLGLTDARDTTLEHEYAHHLTLDTIRNPTAKGNVWADLRNDYYLWRQRHGVPIPEFRACAHAEWVRIAST